MNIQSCKECGIVVNVKKVKKIHTYLPEVATETERDSDGDLLTDDVYYNPFLVWEDDEPLETWSCPICKTFNGIQEEN